jgi:hypothetical protein
VPQDKRRSQRVRSKTGVVEEQGPAPRDRAGAPPAQSPSAARSPSALPSPALRPLGEGAWHSSSFDLAQGLDVKVMESKLSRETLDQLFRS